MRNFGVTGTLARISGAVAPRAPLRRAGVLADFSGRDGLEIGGPSPAFAALGVWPVYAVAARVDNANFGHATVWEGDIAEGRTFRFSTRREAGEQHVAEAADLSFAADGSYDFVLSSHTLEHCANPLKALGEWTRVLKAGGVLALVLPHRDGTFDHRRPVTPLAHLIEDFERGVTEDDLTHLDEILAQHDLAADGGDDRAAFEARSRRNLENRCLHHHVFDTRSALAMVDHAGLCVLSVKATRPYDIAILARKPAPGETADNGAFTSSSALFAARSPFPSDRRAT
jgi:SAM-dependent methyltransferase